MNISINKRQGSPDFVIGSGGFKYEELKAFVNAKGYVNFDVLTGKEGGYYIKISEYGIEKKSEETTEETMSF